ITVMTGYAAQRKALEDAAKANGWVGVKILTVDASQGTENFVMILSLVKTDGFPGFLGKKQRANVATSRQKEALYFVGKEAFWFAKIATSAKWMHAILKYMNATAGFIVRGQGSAAGQQMPVQQITASLQTLAIADTPTNTKQAALEALLQRHQVETDELLTEQLAVIDPLNNQVENLLAKRSEVQQQADLDRIDAEIQRLDEVLKARQDESDKATLRLAAKQTGEVQELEAEEDDNDDDLYSAD
ncbi:MAG: hypothetical protein Q9180_008132, partial [Flavoplaca navasiana]